MTASTATPRALAARVIATTARAWNVPEARAPRRLSRLVARLPRVRGFAFAV